MKPLCTLDDWLAHVEKLHEKPIDLGLDRMKLMIERMGIRFECPVVTVAGTNGKGSTCAMIERICRAAGLRTGMHTSPHLIRFNEIVCHKHHYRLPYRGSAYAKLPAENKVRNTGSWRKLELVNHIEDTLICNLYQIFLHFSPSCFLKKMLDPRSIF